MTLETYQLACIRGERGLFNAVNFNINAGDAMCVAGINGSGKTSLLRMLCGLTLPASGEVYWHGRNIRHAREEFNSQLIYLGHANGMKDDLLAWENVVAAAILSGNSLSRNEACSALAQLGLEQIVDLPIRYLSQGQRRRVALARLHVGLGMKMKLWILDEPFTALDQNAVTQLCATLNEHLARGGMLVYTTHQEITLDAKRALRLELGHLDMDRDDAC